MGGRVYSNGSQYEHLRVREYGSYGPWVVALHGGPAAAGSAAPIAGGLAGRFRVLEPWQRGSGEEPLTVARHVADLHDLILSRCEGQRPALVGESWGAMLALAYAAEHPDDAGPLVLVGCGTFDLEARARLQQTLDERMTAELRARLARLDDDVTDPLERMAKRYELTHHLYDYDVYGHTADDEEEDDDEDGPEAKAFDVRAHTETWNDMVRLQAEGVYPAVFAAIRSPAIMLHGAYDPHPGRMIYEGLHRHMPQLEYREWERCGHSPWRERHVRDEFFAVMCQWLSRRIG
jgi:pimeloyl-ACP methyl ester carboxylesterase